MTSSTIALDVHRTSTVPRTETNKNSILFEMVIDFCSMCDCRGKKEPKTHFPSAQKSMFLRRRSERKTKTKYNTRGSVKVYHKIGFGITMWCVIFFWIRKRIRWQIYMIAESGLAVCNPGEGGGESKQWPHHSGTQLLCFQKYKLCTRLGSFWAGEKMSDTRAKERKK